MNLHFTITAILVISLFFTMQNLAYSINPVSDRYLNSTQIYEILNLVKNSSRFQSVTLAHNFTYDGIFEYVASIPQPNSESKIYAIDFTTSNSTSHSGKLITVWIDPALQIVNITSSIPLSTLKEFGQEWDSKMASLCGKSSGCIMRGLIIPLEAASVCDFPSGCDEIGQGGFSIHLSSNAVTNLNDESPLKQFKVGVPLYMIACKLGFVPMMKISDHTPACVTPLTFKILVQRGWGAFMPVSPAGTSPSHFVPLEGNRTT